MRATAFIQLVCIGALSLSSLFGVHVDHGDIHARDCRADEFSAFCHQEIPHDHKAAHPGQESVIEHAFENAISTLQHFVFAPAFIITDNALVLHAPTFGSTLFLCDDHRRITLFLNSASPRAPPFLLG